MKNIKKLFINIVKFKNHELVNTSKFRLSIMDNQKSSVESTL